MGMGHGDRFRVPANRIKPIPIKQPKEFFQIMPVPPLYKPNKKKRAGQNARANLFPINLVPPQQLFKNRQTSAAHLTDRGWDTGTGSASRITDRGSL